MKFVKHHLDDMKRCYAASSIKMDGKDYAFLASEDPDVACNLYNLNDLSDKQTVWTKPGGCMSIVPIPGRDKEILAVQEFYLKVSPSLSKLVWGKLENGKWVFKDVLHLPYLHRFDLVQMEDGLYFIGATIAESKENKEDWRKAGKLYTGKIPSDLNEGIQIEEIYGGLFRNHGFWKTREGDKDVVYIGSDQGVTKLIPLKNGQYQIEQILEGTIGEVATIDIDGDGEQEIMTIEPFHGNAIKIYKKCEETYQAVYEYQNKIAFAHSLVATTLCGQPTFIAGVRREEAELFYVQWDQDHFVTQCIEKNVGPANLAVVHLQDKDVIVSANHTANEAAIYEVLED